MSTALPPIYEHVHIYQAVKEEKNVLHFFADRCGGQNNNRMVIIALHEIFIKNSIEELSLNFLVSGQSQNENEMKMKMPIQLLKQQHGSTRSIL